MIEVNVKPNWVTVKGLSEQQTEELGAILTVKVPNYWFSDAYKRKAWDGTKKFYGTRNGTFFATTGFLGTIDRFLENEDVERIHVNPYLNDWGGIRPGFDNVDLKDITLREDQVRALYDMFKSGRGILKAPTGSGKTEIAIAYTKWWLEHNDGIVLFLTHRKTIFEQVWAGTEEEEGRIEKRLDVLPISDLYGEFKNDSMRIFILNNNTKKQIIVSMSQTLSGHIKEHKWIKDVGLCFIDECHAIETHSRKSGSIKVHIVSNLVNCYQRFGMSATPFKKQGEKDEKYHKYMTMSNFGDVIEIKSETKIKAKVEMIPINYELTSLDYPHALEQSQENMDKKIAIKTILSTHRDKKTFIFATYIKHGKDLSEYLGIPFIYGETKRVDRNKVCNDFTSGKYDAIIVSKIFHFGVDIREIDLIIFAHIGKGYIPVIQAVGRGMREAEGKTELLIYDFYEKDSSYLEKHSRERLKHYKSKGFEVKNEV